MGNVPGMDRKLHFSSPNSLKTHPMGPVGVPRSLVLYPEPQKKSGKSQNQSDEIYVFQLRQQFSAHNFIDDATSEIASGHQNPSYGTSRCPQNLFGISRTPEKNLKNLKT